jgi:hypothetical protein
MQPLLAIARLTWKAAFRFRLFWILAALLLGSVVLLPLLIKNDGSARGFIQIMLTYTLGVIATLLGFSTLWLACGILARDIEECQVQMVAVKPVARWQIWLGKWLGILFLNGCLLGLSGASVYALLHWRAQQLPPAQQQILRNEVFVARGSMREPPPDLESEAERQLQRVPNFQALPLAQQVEARRQKKEQVKAMHQVVPPNHMRRWTIELGLRRHLLQDQPMYLRVKFYAAETNLNGTYLGLWQVGPLNDIKARSAPQGLAANTFHEIQLPPNAFDENGRLEILFENRNETALIFPLEEDLEVLYREGGFGLNYVRGLGIIFCWLALLAALGLTAASLLSFPVAAFCSLSLLLVALSSGTLASVVQEGTLGGANHETGEVATSWVDTLVLPLFKAILSVVNLVQGFSPVDSLSTGRSISWGQLGKAFTQVVLVLGGSLAGAGMLFLTRRELATAQGTH